MIAKKKSMVEAHEKKWEFEERTSTVRNTFAGTLSLPSEDEAPGWSATPTGGSESVFKSGTRNIKEAMEDAGCTKMEYWRHKWSAIQFGFEEGERQRCKSYGVLRVGDGTSLLILMNTDLRDDALKNAKIPEILHAAVLGLDENKTLPCMFHAAKQVHFL